MARGRGAWALDLVRTSEAPCSRIYWAPAVGQVPGQALEGSELGCRQGRAWFPLKSGHTDQSNPGAWDLGKWGTLRVREPWRLCPARLRTGASVGGQDGHSLKGRGAAQGPPPAVRADPRPPASPDSAHSGLSSAPATGLGLKLTLPGTPQFFPQCMERRH